MKTPIDLTQTPTESTADAAERPETVRLPGGKVLQRLKLFTEARNLPIEAAVAEVAGESPTQDNSAVAQLYADAANASQATSAEMEVMAPGAPAPAAPPAPPSWRPLGPVMIPNGQTYGASRVPVSGRVATVAIDPSNRSHVLVGSAGGGIWESRDTGATWAPRTDFMPTLTTGAIAFDRLTPAVVYAGTGEGNFYAPLGAGVLRSTNGGTTWSVLASSPFLGQGFYDLLVNPANSSQMLAATTGGIYKSANAGVAWTQRRSSRCWSLSMHPAGGAAAEVLGACSDGLYRSADSGQTWAAVPLPGAPASFNRLAACHSRSNPAVAYVFGTGLPLIRIPGDSDPTHLMPTPYLWRRNTAGGAFAAVTPPAGLVTTQDWYDWFIGVAPDTENRIYLGAIDVFRGELSGSTWSWSDISSKPAGDSIHPDQHAITFDPVDANTIYVGNDGGLFRSPNRGVNWQHLNSGLGITEIEYVAQDYGSTRWLLAGTQDNGSIRYTGSAVWDHVADGDGGDCAVNRGNPNTVFHSYYGMGMERSTTKGDFGSFAWIGPNVPQNYGSLFYPPMEDNGDVISQAGQSVFLSRNNGTSWTEIALPAGCTATAMFMPTGNELVVGCTNGRIFRVNWTGASWSAANALTTPRNNAWVSDLWVDPANLNRIWATSSSVGGGRVFRSDNGGTSWVDRSAGLPNLPINSIQVDPGNGNRVWVAADVGVYQSLNGGSNWSGFSLGLPNALVEDLLYHPHARVLRAGTRNRGVWEIPVNGWLVNPICGVQWTGTLPPNGQARWFTFNWPAVWHVIWSVMPTNPQPGARQVGWSVQVERASGEYATYWITVKNLTSAPLTFEGRYCILSYY